MAHPDLTRIRQIRSLQQLLNSMDNKNVPIKVCMQCDGMIHNYTNNRMSLTEFQLQYLHEYYSDRFTYDIDTQCLDKLSADAKADLPEYKS